MPAALLEARTHAAAFLEPANQLLHNAAATIAVSVKFNPPRVAVLVGLAWNDWKDLPLKQQIIDAVHPIPFVTSKANRNDGQITFVAANFLGIENIR